MEEEEPLPELESVGAGNNETTVATVASQSRKWVKSRDVFILRRIPVGSLVGIDTDAFGIQKNEEFFGVKEVPPGPHFVWGGSVSGSMRNGFWVISPTTEDGSGSIHEFEWDNYSESLTCKSDTASQLITGGGGDDIYEKLKSYGFTKTDPTGNLVKASNLWARLSSQVTIPLLTKITGRNGMSWSISSSDDIEISNPASMIDVNDNVLNFVFPKSTRTFTASSIGRQRTEQAQDTSSHVDSIIAEACSDGDPLEIVGELQFCYITGVILGNLTCMEQWGHIVKIVFKAYRLALEKPALVTSFIDAVHAQLLYDEEGVESSILDQDPTLPDELRMILTIFKSRLDELHSSIGVELTSAQRKVIESFEALETFLQRWNWNLRGDYVRSGKIQLEDGEIVDAALTEFEDEDERGEYAPQVVELDEHGREKGLYSW